MEGAARARNGVGFAFNDKELVASARAHSRGLEAAVDAPPKTGSAQAFGPGTRRGDGEEQAEMKLNTPVKISFHFSAHILIICGIVRFIRLQCI